MTASAPSAPNLPDRDCVASPVCESDVIVADTLESVSDCERCDVTVMPDAEKLCDTSCDMEKETLSLTVGGCDSLCSVSDFVTLRTGRGFVNVSPREKLGVGDM